VEPHVIEGGICPACGKKSLRTVIVEKTLPHFGRAVIMTSKCSSCGYTHTDVIELEVKGEKTLELKVDGPEKLNYVVVRSSSSSLRIPELDLELHPGPFSNGFITTVEGVLDRFEDAARKWAPSTEEERTLKEKALKEIRNAKDGKIPFTLILEDPRGVSGIIPPDDVSSLRERRESRRPRGE
jgi:zinc finger protein